MPDVELARRPGVELVRTGRFQTLTGSWNPTPADIKAAVEAMDCPAIRKPVIRIGHTDQRFVGDGEPALGWFENLRAADGGHTLVADQVTLPWLHSVQAAAYPSRSIEGNYNHRCSEGHLHPFVIHTVALLGVTAPGVQTLRSLNDLPDMLGVAASGEVPEGAEHVQVTILAAEPAPDGDGDDDDEHTGAIVALIPAAEDAARLAVEGGEAPEELHLTLAYLGEAADLGASGWQDIVDAVSTAVNGMPTVDATAFAVTAFNPVPDSDNDTCLVYGVTGDLLDTVHDFVMRAVDQSAAGTRIPAQILPWVAHVTAAYTDDLGRLSDLAAKLGPVRFDRVRLAFAGQYTDIPLIDWDEEPDDPSRIADDDGMVAAAAGNTAELKKYWLAGPGLAKWADKPHPWTALYKALRKYIKDPDEAKRTASQWYRLHFGHMPNAKSVMAGRHSAPDFDEHKHPRDRVGKFAHTAGNGGPALDRKVRIRGSDGKPMFLEVHDGAATMRFPYDEGDESDPDRHVPDHGDTIALDREATAEFADDFGPLLEERDRYLGKAQQAWNDLTKLEDSGRTGTPEYAAAQDAWFKVGGDGQRIAGGEIPGSNGSTLVYEMRMGNEVTDTDFLIGLRPAGAAPEDWDLQEAAADQAGAFLNMSGFRRLRKELTSAAPVAASSPSDLPAAEPEHEIPTEPKEDLVSDLSAFRSRLGLDDTADEQAILSALDVLKTKADTPAPAEPTPEMVAASAAATEKAERAQSALELMKEELARQSSELATIKASAASTVKASFFGGLVTAGKLKPADRETWEARYDRDPEMVSEILGGRAEGSEVPVMASGTVGSAEPDSAEDVDAEFDREFAGLFSRKVS